MKRSYLFLAEGFEEIEALTVVDIMRRAGMEVTTVSINDEPEVTSAKGTTVLADMPYTEIRNFNDADWLITPGGMPGSQNLADFAPLTELLKTHAADGGRVAAICAAPAVVLAPLGILKGKKTTCYPGMDKALKDNGAKASDEMVVVDGNIITGKGPAAAMAFAIAIVRADQGDAIADEVASGLLFK